MSVISGYDQICLILHNVQNYLNCKKIITKTFFVNWQSVKTSLTAALPSYPRAHVEYYDTTEPKSRTGRRSSNLSPYFNVGVNEVEDEVNHVMDLMSSRLVRFQIVCVQSKDMNLANACLHYFSNVFFTSQIILP